MPQVPARDRIPLPLIVLILGASFLIISGPILFFHVQKEKLIARTYNELGIISTLKAEEVLKWRQEHIRDGSIMSSFLPVNKLMYRILGEGDDEKTKNEILQGLLLFFEDYDYQSIVIIDEKSRVRLNYPSSNLTNIEFLPVKEFRSNILEFSDLHFSEGKPDLHIDMLIPVIPPDSIVFTNPGMIIVQINPEISLFPNLRILSTPSSPAEILLVRRDGDSVTYLNHDSNMNGRFLRRSMKNRNIPAVRAVEGVEGIFEGRDYNDLPVLAFLRKIPNSPWALVVKVDKFKALYVLYRQSLLISIIALLFILTFITIVFYLWRKQRIRFYKELSITKDRFVSIISHDLTNPFTSIAGFSELLSNDIKKGNYANALKFAEIINESSISATELIRNLVQWSRIQTNQIRLNRIKINLTTLIHDSVALMKASANRKNIRIHIKTPYEMPVCADKEMIRTVLRNLITNAIKFSNQGGEIYITADRKDNGVIAEIIDFGIGMDKEILDNIFRAEYISSTKGTQSETGTGLGLRLCKEFIGRHGGTIEAESRKGHGSKFTFTIPDVPC